MGAVRIASQELALGLGLNQSGGEMNLCMFRRSRGFAAALALFGAASVVSASGEPLKDWQTPKLTGLGNQPPHATMGVCPERMRICRSC